MSFSTDETIEWKGRSYYGASRIGVVKRTYAHANDPNEIHESFVIDLNTTPTTEGKHQGQYLTVIPISSQGFREQHRCWKSGYALVPTGIAIYCDYGNLYFIGCCMEVAEKIADECREWGLKEKVTQ